MATSTNGTYMFCDADLNFSITFSCTGPACNSTISHEGLTCTQKGSESWTCSNGVKCATAIGFNSTFSISGTNTTVVETQQLSVNGTSTDLKQDGAGNATLYNGTTTAPSSGSSTAVTTALSSSTSTVASPSASKSGSKSLRHSFSSILLVAMLCLSLFMGHAHATVTAANIGISVNAIFQGLVHVGDGKSPFDIGAAAIAEEFNSIANKTCATSNGQDAGGLSLVYSECEEAMVGAEMSLIGSSLGVTVQNYSGLGGAQATSLTSAGEATVVASDAGAIPALFIANSALCGLLVVVIQQSSTNSSESLCSALQSAVQSHESTSSLTTSSSSSTTTATSSSRSTTTATTAAATTITTTTCAQATPTAAGVLPSGITSNKCLSCFLNTYLCSLVVTSTETCNNAPVVSASAYDLSGIFCDPQITTSYSQFCTSLCAKPCTPFSVAAIIKAMGSDYIADPANNVFALGKQCNACPVEAQDIKPMDFQCKTMPTCLCGLGSQLCAVGCSG